MEGIENLKYLIRKDDFLVKLDLQDAFLTKCLRNTTSFYDSVGKELSISTSVCPLAFHPLPVYLQRF